MSNQLERKLICDHEEAARKGHLTLDEWATKIGSGPLMRKFYATTALDDLGRQMDTNKGREPMPMNQTEKERFRSFAERYVIERANKFDDKEPRKDAWHAVQDALSIYENIAQVGDVKFTPRMEEAQQANHSGGRDYTASHSGCYWVCVGKHATFCKKRKGA